MRWLQWSQGSRGRRPRKRQTPRYPHYNTVIFIKERRSVLSLQALLCGRYSVPIQDKLREWAPVHTIPTNLHYELFVLDLVTTAHYIIRSTLQSRHLLLPRGPDPSVATKYGEEFSTPGIRNKDLRSMLRILGPSFVQSFYICPSLVPRRTFIAWLWLVLFQPTLYTKLVLLIRHANG